MPPDILLYCCNFVKLEIELKLETRSCVIGFNLVYFTFINRMFSLPFFTAVAKQRRKTFRKT